jgi:predicted oxidoreductase (fatty acid repression mutant protein)
LPEQARERVKMFDQAYATILFYMDTNVVNQLAKKYPQYKDNFNT